jgi:hypothetical protein
MTNNKPNLIRADSKAKFLSIMEKHTLELILQEKFNNTKPTETVTRQIISDIFEKINNANAINFDYEDENYLEVS